MKSLRGIQVGAEFLLIQGCSSHNILLVNKITSQSKHYQFTHFHHTVVRIETLCTDYIKFLQINLTLQSGEVIQFWGILFLTNVLNDGYY